MNLFYLFYNNHQPPLTLFSLHADQHHYSCECVDLAAVWESGWVVGGNDGVVAAAAVGGGGDLDL